MTMQLVLAFAWNPAVGIPLFIVGVIVLGLIWLFGQPKKEQGRRRMPAAPAGEERREPTFGEVDVAEDEIPHVGTRDDFRLDPLDEPSPHQGELDVGLREELEKLGATLSGERVAPAPVSKPMGAAASIIEALRAPPEQFLAAQGHSPAPAEPAPRAHAPISAPAPVAEPAPAPVKAFSNALPFSTRNPIA